MKKMLLRLLLFSIPLLLLLAGEEIALQKIPNDYSLKKNQLSAQADSIEVLILGNSHAYFGVNPRFFSVPAFNASYVSQSLDYDYAILKKYGETLPQLKVVILSISYSTLYKRLSSSEEAWRAKYYTIYHGIALHSNPLYYSEVLSGNMKQNTARLMSAYYERKNLCTSDSKGWGISYGNELHNDLEETGAKAAKRHIGGDTTWYDENCVVLDSILQYAAKRNIQVLLFTPPAYASYYTNLDQSRLARIETLLSAKDAQNPFCTYVNLLRDTTFSADMFFDADHLNHRGAEHLSKMLSRYCTKASAE